MITYEKPVRLYKVSSMISHLFYEFNMKYFLSNRYRIICSSQYWSTYCNCSSS